MRVGSSSRLPFSHVPLVEPRSFSVQTPPACTSIMQWNAETPVPSSTMVLLASRPIVTCVPGNGCVRVVPSGAVTRRLYIAQNERLSMSSDCLCFGNCALLSMARFTQSFVLGESDVPSFVATSSTRARPSVLNCMRTTNVIGSGPLHDFTALDAFARPLLMSPDDSVSCTLSTLGLSGRSGLG